MYFIRDFIHRWFYRLERNKIKIQTYRQEKANIVSVLHSEYKWRKVRNSFVSAHAKCACCGIEKKLEVHHIRPWHIFPALRYSFDNLITLCRECHFRFGHGRNWKFWNPEICELSKTLQTNLDNIQK